jgi:hypothetical protein
MVCTKMLVAAWENLELWLLLQTHTTCAASATNALLAGSYLYAIMTVRVSSHGHRFSTIVCRLDVSAASRELIRRVEYRAEESLVRDREPSSLEAQLQAL